MQLLKNLYVFDAAYLGYAAQVPQDTSLQNAHNIQNQLSTGYLAEQNHAFFPLFPWMANKVEMLIGGDASLAYVTPLMSVVQTALNTILLYRVGVLTYDDAKMAEVAGYLYILSHSALYQIAFYSENTFLLFTLLGLYILHAGPQSSTQRRPYSLPSPLTVLLACFSFACATLTRSTGVLLSLFIAFYLGNYILVNSGSCRKSFFATYIALLCVIIMFIPLITVTNWVPYLKHCVSRYENGPVGVSHPEWCYDTFPNVYTYIQLKHWENRFLGFLYRKPEQFLTSIPMNVIYMYVTWKLVRNKTRETLSFGIMCD